MRETDGMLVCQYIFCFRDFFAFFMLGSQAMNNMHHAPQYHLLELEAMMDDAGWMQHRPRS
jgi:hypothetical protein